MPPGAREYLRAPSLESLWSVLRERLERNGLAVRGFVVVELDDDGADRLSGLLGRPVGAGAVRMRLAELDAALRASAAGRGLVAVVAELTGGPLRNRPAERDAVRAGRQELWAQLGDLLERYDLADRDWVKTWSEWLRRGGLVTRLPAAKAAAALATGVQVLARVLDSDHPPVGLAELASEVTGDAHGLDDGVAGRPGAARARVRAGSGARDVGRGTPDAVAARRGQYRRDLRHGDHVGAAAAGRGPLVGHDAGAGRPGAGHAPDRA